MTQSIFELFYEYQMFFLAGIVGSIAYRAKHSMHYRKFIKHVVYSIFVSLVVGLTVSSLWTTLNSNFIFAMSAISGYMSEDVIAEIREIISGLSDVVHNMINKKIDSSNETPTPEAQERPHEEQIETSHTNQSMNDDVNIMHTPEAQERPQS